LKATSQGDGRHWLCGLAGCRQIPYLDQVIISSRYGEDRIYPMFAAMVQFAETTNGL